MYKRTFGLISADKKKAKVTDMWTGRSEKTQFIMRGRDVGTSVTDGGGGEGALGRPRDDEEFEISIF